MITRLASFVLAAALACASSLHAQIGTPAFPVVARDSGARVERIAPGVFAIVHADATTDWRTGVTDWPHGNTGVIVGSDAVLVVDATYLPSRARADIALIRSLTDKPVRYLVNTHWHGDHTHGNGAYRDAFPGIAIVSQETNRDWIGTNQARYPRMVTAGRGGKQATVAGLESLLASGKDSAGTALTAADRAAIQRNIRDRRQELDEFTRIPIVSPTVGFGDRMSIDLGGQLVLLENRGRANSPADVTIHVPSARTLFTGDIVVYPVPYVGASHPLPWIDVLKSIESAPSLDVIVPGHGPVMKDRAYVTLVRELFEATRDRVRQSMEQGLPMDSILKQVTLDDFRDRFVRLPVKSIGDYWEGTPAVLVERMHQCVQGYRC